MKTKIFLASFLSLLLFFGAVEAKAENKKRDGHLKADSALEVSIKESGEIAVRNAKVTAVSGTTISAVTNWGQLNMSWLILTDGSQLPANSSISVGDMVSFKGRLDQSSTQPTVKAEWIKKVSLKAEFRGTVKSLLPNGFVLQTNSGSEVNVTVNGSTEIKGFRKKHSAVFAGVKVGDRVKNVKGVFDAATNTLAAEKITVHIAFKVKE